MGAVYLIRHGQASFGSANYDVLSELGVRQARECGRYLAQKGLKIDAWYNGSLQRQQDTAKTILATIGPEQLEPVQNTGFDEFDHTKVLTVIMPELARSNPLIAEFLAATGDRRKLFQPVFELAVSKWLEQDEWPQMESWRQFNQRVQAAIEKVLADAEKGQNIAVVSSGGPISAIIGQLLGLSPVKAIDLSWTLANASISKIFYSGSRRSLAYFNNYSYLQKADDRALISFR